MIYPENLQKLLIRNRGMIPKKINYKEPLKLFHKYWTIELPNYIFKVHSIFEADNIEYYQIKSLDSMYQSALSFPLNNEFCFELMQDRNNIKDLPNIINSSIGYFGSEIRYWFFVNQIDYNDGKYIGFKSYIDYTGKNSLSDSKIYFLKGELKNNIYTNCYAKLIKS